MYKLIIVFLIAFSGALKMFVDIDSVNPAAKYLTLFFMIKITYYTPLINIEGGATWLPF